MAHFVGLDVSLEETSVCVVDDVGKVLCERKVRTEPEDIAVLLTSIGGDYVRIGIEAGPLSQWLVNGLIEADLPVVCVETRHMKALLKAQQVNKSDRNDARGIAQMMRVGLFNGVRPFSRTGRLLTIDQGAGPCRSKAHGSSSHPQSRVQEAGRAGVRRRGDPEWLGP
jgi:transposase